MKCVICRRKFEGHGNNALPIKEGKCCDKCNQEVVVPFRIIQFCGMEQYRKDILEAYGIKEKQ